ncbi:hypothetical protein BKA93DRAFT_359480 [Sparassis latifolia]
MQYTYDMGELLFGHRLTLATSLRDEFHFWTHDLRVRYLRPLRFSRPRSLRDCSARSKRTAAPKRRRTRPRPQLVYLSIPPASTTTPAGQARCCYRTDRPHCWDAGGALLGPVCLQRVAEVLQLRQQPQRDLAVGEVERVVARHTADSYPRSWEAFIAWCGSRGHRPAWGASREAAKSTIYGARRFRPT